MRALALAMLLAGFAARAAEELEVSGPVRAQAQRAGELMRECRYEEADAIVAAALKDASPADRRFMLLTAGMLAEHRNDLPAAIRLYQEAAAGEKVALEALHMLGRAQIANRQFAEGHKALMGYVNTALKVERRYPTESDLAALAVAAAELGELEEALKIVDVARREPFSYGALTVDLQAALQAARDGKGASPPGTFWKLAYGGEQPIGMPVEDFSMVPVRRTAPLYPRAELRDGIEGHAVLRMRVDDKGNVTDARVVESAPNERFGNAARIAIRKWKFKPRVLKCKAVPSEGLQRIDFRLAN